MLKKLSYGAVALSILYIPTPVQANTDFISDGKFFGEVRYRYEHVDQEGIAKNANANTLRTNLGFVTGEVEGFQALIEG